MSGDPRQNELRTDGVPESDPVGPGGGDSVQDLHKPHMDIMNDPVVLSADGTVHTTPGPEVPFGQDRLQAMHQVLMREQAEPRDGFEPVPFWVAVVCGGLLMWGGYYLGTTSADFRKDVFDRSDLSGLRPPGTSGPSGPEPDPQTLDELMKIGSAKYQVCAACHQPHGNGDATQGYPPLNGSEWVVGPEASPARLARILLYGLHQPIAVKGRTFNGQMPAQGGTMRDYEIAAVITFIRNSWDNKAEPVTAATVKAARAKVGDRKTNGTAPFSADELKKLPLDYSDVAPAAKTDAKKDDAKK